MKLRSITFSWKNGDSRERHPGLIAQEVYEIFPEVVRGSIDGSDVLGLNYSELVPILINVIKDLRGEVSGQPFIIEDLEKRLEALSSPNKSSSRTFVSTSKTLPTLMGSHGPESSNLTLC